MKSNTKSTHIDKKEITKIDPMLGKPTDDIERNLAEGIDEMIPDADDVPGGLEEVKLKPDILDSNAQALLEKREEVTKSPKKKSKKK